MKPTFPSLLGVACLALGLVGAQTTARAFPVNGELDFTGVATTDTGKLSTAHSFTSFSSVSVVGNVTGEYAGKVEDGDPVAMNGFTFNPVGSGATPLWTINLGYTFEFDLTKVTSFLYNPSTGGLTIKGIGLADIETNDPDLPDTYTPTPAVFTFSTQEGSSGATRFTFSSATFSAPDSGTTVALLGLGLVAVEGTRRALGANRAVKA